MVLWNNLPKEMRDRPQWCVSVGSDTEKRPLYYTDALYEASSTNSRTWMTYEKACQVAVHYGMHIGFIFTKEDPFTVIDLDVKDATDYPLPKDEDKITTEAQKAAYQKLILMINSYTEYSRSGKGYHIIVYGDIGAGARYPGIAEVYSRDRFVICTGNTILAAPIIEGGELLTGLVHDIRARQANHANAVDLIEIDEEEAHADYFICDLACEASNGEKYNALCRGEWQDLGYPSQSEADTALLAMLCFYTQSNAQVRRLFRMTALGKRQKATCDDRYINLTLNMIRSRQLSEYMDIERCASDAQKLADTIAATIASEQPAQVEQLEDEDEIEEFSCPAYSDDSLPVHDYAPAYQVIEIAKSIPLDAVYDTIATGSVQAKHTDTIIDLVYSTISNPQQLDFPNGRLGDIAKHVYETSPRPVKEIAIATALGFGAGLCGRTYNISNSGLNLYIVVIARSAVGKETLHSGCSQLFGELNPILQETNFVDFSKYASGPALLKGISTRKSVVNIFGEFGRKLQEFANSDSGSASQTLRTVITDLYQKSGRFSKVGGMAYSNKDNNTEIDSAIAYSLIGESTPEAYYSSLTSTMMEDGFLSRFTGIEYNGIRAPLNMQPARNLRRDLVEYIEALAERLQQANLVSGAVTNVVADAAVAEAIYAVEAFCDNQINATVDESERQMWNRASLKTMRMAALLAVFENLEYPIVRAEHYLWALNLIMLDVKTMYMKKKNGDIGASDTSRAAKILQTCNLYLCRKIAPMKGQTAMRDAGIITRATIMAAVSNLSSFTSTKFGTSKAVDGAILELITSGTLREVPPKVLTDKYHFSGKAYYIISAN